uniref:Uncharacterized protein n=1 Tax=viral metagenome TaxID=1070528 RepID=A0A6C0JWK3_9ZZZZ
MANIFYGTYDRNIDVTNKIIAGNIPQQDGNRAAIFGDPCYGHLKHVTYKDSTRQIIYPYYVTGNVSRLLEALNTPPTTYVIVSTCLLPGNFEIRKEQYIRGINSIIDKCATIPNTKIILVENNGQRQTFLDEFVNNHIAVLYTRNNFLPTWNKGRKELLDVLACIETFKIRDQDFIVKVTGRYYLDPKDCPFFDRLKEGTWDSIMRYGNYCTGPDTPTGDCILGIVGMRCKYVKEINVPVTESAEISWAAKSLNIPDNKQCVITDHLGIYIAPGTNTYFLV